MQYESFNTLDNTSGRICVLNKTNNAGLTGFDMIANTN